MSGRRRSLYPLLLALLLAPPGCAATIRDIPARSAGIEPRAERLEEGRGALILEGGGSAAEAATRLIVERAGPAPLLCLVATASEGAGHPENRFQRFSGVKLRVLDIRSGDGDAPAVAASLRDCTGIYFDGGNPELLSRAFVPGGRATPALEAIRERAAKAGVALSGTSAGAMIVGPVTLCECGAGSSVASLSRGELFQAPGFGVVDGVLIDAHFFARGLLGRHAFALARNHLPVGVGIDEQTAVVVPPDGGPWRVVGNRAVALVESPPQAMLDDLRGFRLSVLTPGDTFDPSTRRIEVAEQRRSVALKSGGEAIEVADIFAPNAVRTAAARLIERGADRVVGRVPGTSLRLVLYRTAETRAWSDGRTMSIARLAIDILRG